MVDRPTSEAAQTAVTTDTDERPSVESAPPEVALQLAGTATWISANDRSLYGFVHSPQGPAKGVVIIVGSVGREQVVAFRALRVLAIELAKAGFVAIRVSLSGTGESSAMPTDRDPVLTWCQDLSAVEMFALSELGQSRVHVIGLRLGGALLSRWERASDGLSVAWEPVAGKAFLAQHRALRLLSIGEPVVDQSEGTELAGYLVAPNMRTGLRALEAPVAKDGLEIVTEDPVVAQLLYATATLFARVPLPSIARLIARLEQESEAVASIPQWQPHAVTLIETPTGQQVRETLVSVGPYSAPGVLTEPLDQPSSGQTWPAVVFCAGSSEPKDGPTGLWVAAARGLAAAGIMSLRVERRSCGDLGDPEAIMDPNPYVMLSVDDMVIGADWLAARTGAPVSAVGLCAGAWQVLMACGATRNIRQAIVFGSVAWRRGTRFYRRLERAMMVDTLSTPTNTTDSSKSGEPLKVRAKEMVKYLLRYRLPYQLWLALGRREVTNVPELLLQSASAHCRIDLVMGREDVVNFDLERGPRSLVRLKRRGRDIRFHVESHLDHALLAQTARASACQIIKDLVASSNKRPLGD